MANIGGEILGELADGRLLIASLAPLRAMTLYAVALDGRTERIAEVADAIGPVAAPAGSAAVLSRYLRPYEDRTGVSTIINFDLETRRQTFSQPVGVPNNLSFAATHVQVEYVFTDPKAFFAAGDHPGYVVLGARGGAGANWDVVRLRRACAVDAREDRCLDRQHIRASRRGGLRFRTIRYEHRDQWRSHRRDRPRRGGLRGVVTLARPERARLGLPFTFSSETPHLGRADALARGLYALGLARRRHGTNPELARTFSTCENR